MIYATGDVTCRLDNGIVNLSRLLGSWIETNSREQRTIGEKATYAGPPENSQIWIKLAPGDYVFAKCPVLTTTSAEWIVTENYSRHRPVLLDRIELWVPGSRSFASCRAESKFLWARIGWVATCNLMGLWNDMENPEIPKDDDRFNEKRL